MRTAAVALMLVTGMALSTTAVLAQTGATTSSSGMSATVGASSSANDSSIAGFSLLNGPIHFTVPALAGGDSVRVGTGNPMTLVAVFATWCAPCRDEVPVLNMLQRDFGNRVRVIALSMDDASTQYVQGWLKKYGAQYPVARDRNGAARNLGVTGVPVLYLVNNTGHIEWKRSGSLISALPELRGRLKLLPELSAQH